MDGTEEAGRPGAGDRVRSYGRRRGHRLRPRRQGLIDTLLPRLRVPLPPDGGALDPASLFPGPSPGPSPGLSPGLSPGAGADLWLEVGFGAGEHLVAQARAHPDVGMIGCEPFVNGVAALLDRIDREGLANVRVLDDDARKLMDALPARSLGRMFVLFSDPWPKTRHHKRRFINPATVDAAARLLKDGAELRFASDHMGYVRWALEHLRRHPGFAWTARSARDWRQPPADGAETRYERKALSQGRRCIYLTFRRRARA